jgi:hypothetical protein
MPYAHEEFEHYDMGWIKKNRQSIIIALLGLALMALREVDLGRWPAYRVFWSKYHLIAYVVEHLGAVLFVAMLVRVAIEQGYERAFLRDVNEQVKAQIHETSREALKPLSQEVKNASDLVTDMDKGLQRLSKSLTYRIIQNLSDDLRKVLEEYVFNSSFVRPEFYIHLKLERFNDAQGTPGILNASVGIRYRVKNRSDKTASYSVESWVTDLIRPNNVRESRFTRFAYGPVIADGQSNLLPAFDLKSMEAAGKISERDGRLYLRQDIDGIAPDCTYEVIVASRQLMREHDFFIWSVTTLTEKVGLTVELAGGLQKADLDIRLTAIHHAHNKADVDKRDPSKITMTLHQVFLPYQGIEVRWSPQATSKPAPDDHAQVAKATS